MKRSIFLIFLFLPGTLLQARTQVADQKNLLTDFRQEEHFQEKMKDGKDLIDRAVDHFKKNSLAAACRDFETDRNWRIGEFFVFIFGTDGTCYLFGKELLPLWENFTKEEGARAARGLSPLGYGFIEEMVEVGKTGGWVSYNWSYSTDYSYVRTVEKDGKTYILGTGFYPEYPRFTIQQMVKRAIRLAESETPEALFREINNPQGRFVQGPFYLWAYDMKGNAFAHGKNLAIVGQNRLDWKDSDGKYRNRIIIDALKDSSSAWITYEENGALKEAYIESFTDPRTNTRYFVGGGYYPDITDDTVVSFVKRGINYLKSEGPVVALRDFSSRAGGFEDGPLRMFVFDLQGNVLADAQNPIFIGQNLMNSRDSEGTYIVKELIEVAKRDGRGWVTFIDNNAYKNTYVELVEIPNGKYVIGAGFWPSSKAHNARSMAEKAATFMENNTLPESLRKFVGTGSEFLRGDIFVSVYTEEGVCLAYGTDRSRIWADERLVLDNKGYPFIDRVIDTAKRGGGWVEFMRNRRTFRAYTIEVKKKLDLTGTARSFIPPEEPIKTSQAVTQKPAKQKRKTSESYIISVGYYP